VVIKNKRCNISTTKQYVPIFLSSTYTDLIPYRKSVSSVFDKLKLGINGMEIFGARTADPIQTCIEEVKKSKIFIAILGMRYGSVDNETGKSFVQIEYETALSEKIDILIYIINENESQIPPIYVDKNENAKKLEDFKDFLRKNHTVDTFTTPDDLAIKIERDIVRLLQEKEIKIDEGKFEPLSDNKKTIELIKKFHLMPKKLNGTEIELVVKFRSNPFTIEKETCDALDLTYGASIGRQIEIVEPSDRDINYLNFLDELFADYNLCEFLYDVDITRPCKIIAKLSFGYERRIIRKSEKSFFSPSIPPLIDLKTREKIENYISYSPKEALILVKPV
jgi:hypothetical protein